MNDGLFVRWGPTPQPSGLRRAETPGFKLMDFRANVEVRIDVAAILQWIVIAASIFLT